MTTESNTLTRREALLNAIKGSLAASLTMPCISKAVEAPPAPEPEFVPENDYPFFGWEPESIENTAFFSPPSP